MNCPQCGFKNEESARFCEHCGAQLPSGAAGTSQDDTVAFRNGGETVFGQGGDPTGRPFQGNGSWQEEQVDWGSPQGGDTVRGYPENRCRNCGSLLDEGCGYCPVCGAPVNGPGWTNPGNQGPGPSGYGGNGGGKNQKSLTKQILLVLLVLFLLIDGILAGYYFYTKSDDTQTDSQEADSQEDSDETDSQETDSQNQDPDEEQTAEAAASPTPEPTKEPEVVHIYEYYIDNCSWEEAYQKCRAQNGYLARIESAEEFETICREIQAKGMQSYMFFIGARRDPGTSSYYWIDENNVVTGEPINDVSSPLNSYWMANEPSFTDGAIQETCMAMNFYKGENRWVINDVPNELTDVVPQYTGKIGYICEYEITR